MDKIVINQISHSKYTIIVTVLDYEIPLNKTLKELKFNHFVPKHIIVDLALQAGIDKYRFVEFTTDTNGKIILNSKKYINDISSFEDTANTILREHKDIVLHSILTEKQKEYILN